VVLDLEVSGGGEVLNLTSIINKFFYVVESSRNEEFVEYVVLSARDDMSKLFDELYDELVPMGYYPILYKAGDVITLRILTTGRRKGTSTKSSLVFFSLTLASVVVTGFYISTDFHNRLKFLLGYSTKTTDVIYDTLFFMFSVMIPLITHELGHLTIVKRFNIPSTYPLLIPAPFISPLGTFGAIVKMDFLPKNLKCLLKLGISGPLLGFITSLSLFIITYNTSPKLSLDVALVGLREGIVSPIDFMPLSAYLVMTVFDIHQTTSSVVLLNPAAYASMIMLLIHFVNLLPIGQLDGGHVVRAVTSIRFHSLVSVTVASLLILYSLVSIVYLRGSMVWLGIFALLALLISGFKPHIGSANMLDSSSVSKDVKVRYIMIYLTLLTLSIPLPT
jgi:Zn-dependent protease